MTEQEWLASTDPAAMLESVRGKVSDRKLRLFAVAVTRMALAMRRKSLVMLEDAETAERFADGLASESDMVIARISSNLWCCNEYADIAAVGSAIMVRDRATETADLLRDIVGNPFRPVTLAACNCGSCVAPGRQHHNGPCAVRRLRTPTVRNLAQAAYDDRDEATGHLDPLRLAILADALEEAGCPQTIQCHRCDGNGQQFFSLADGGIVCKDGVVRSGWKDCPRCDGSSVEPHPLLTHLRSPGPHVRGCWAVDLVLGRE
jgi:hypothetical protein